MTSTADVVVIGGGVAGLCTARLLAERGTSVIVLPGARSGASAASHGQVRIGLLEHAYRVVASLGLAQARDVFDRTVASVSLLRDWGLLTARGGHWLALDAREPDELARSQAALADLGIRAEVHTPAAHGLPVPGAGPALMVPDEGWVDPKQALGGLRQAAVQAGAVWVQGAQAERVTSGAEGLVVYAGEAVVSAEVVVYAGGATLPQLEPYFHHKVVPVREQALASGPLPAEHPALGGPGGRAGHGYTWWRPAPGGGALWVGGARWATPHLEVGETEPVVVNAVQAKLQDFLHRLAPKAAVARRWAWIEGYSCDGLPLVGPLPGGARHIACTAFSGNDWGLAPAAAATVVDGLLGEGPSAVHPLFSPSRFL